MDLSVDHMSGFLCMVQVQSQKDQDATMTLETSTFVLSFLHFTGLGISSSLLHRRPPVLLSIETTIPYCTPLTIMPLVKLFARNTLNKTVPQAPSNEVMQNLWVVTPPKQQLLSIINETDLSTLYFRIIFSLTNFVHRGYQTVNNQAHAKTGRTRVSKKMCTWISVPTGSWNGRMSLSWKACKTYRRLLPTKVWLPIWD